MNSIKKRVLSCMILSSVFLECIPLQTCFAADINIEERKSSINCNANNYETKEMCYERYQEALQKFNSIEFGEDEIASGIDEIIKDEIDRNYSNLINSYEKPKTYKSRAKRSVPSGFPPESQKEYKLWVTYSKKVKEIRKDANNFEAIGSDLMAGSTIAGAVTKKVPLLVTVTAVAGGTTYLTGRGVNMTLKGLRDDAKYVTEVYFKWINPKEYQYKVKTVTWVEYNGKRISEKFVGYNDNSF